MNDEAAQEKTLGMRIFSLKLNLSSSRDQRTGRVFATAKQSRSQGSSTAVKYIWQIDCTAFCPVPTRDTISLSAGLTRVTLNIASDPSPSTRHTLQRRINNRLEAAGLSTLWASRNTVGSESSKNITPCKKQVSAPISGSSNGFTSDNWVLRLS